RGRGSTRGGLGEDSVDTRAVDAEEARGFGNVSPGLGNGSADERAFGGLEVERQRFVGRRRGRRRDGGKRRRGRARRSGDRGRREKTQMHRGDRAAAAGDEAALDHVAQFADVPRPGVCREGGERLGADRGRGGQAHFGGEVREEVRGEQR